MIDSINKHAFIEANIGKIDWSTNNPDKGARTVWTEVKAKVTETLEAKTYWIPNMWKWQIPYFEKLGFKILETDKNMYEFHTVTLPENWKMSERHPETGSRHILDEQGRRRVYISDAVRFSEPTTRLLKRYDIRYQKLDDENMICFVYDTSGGDESDKVEDFVKIYELRYPLSRWRQKYTNAEEKAEFDKDYRKYITAVQKYEKLCRKFLEENYPAYNDPTAYWD
ncbi:MAG: hypothetical protein ACD_2C00003G0002 [uncultured bacterium (gcode 4)]|uniref:Uncharacterized protein n=1 Tax=uncultured bacterium (gcode 4) TaxID=1234023 RepID=K2FGR7_9BACT|nr:MAG: hypothetical protein ACD_2C00003G0002 [uncultured bacterium (gcode 4)]